MAAPDLTIAAGATRPPLAWELRDADGRTVDLTDATRVTIDVGRPGHERVVGDRVTVVAPRTGEVRYEWPVAATAEPGVFRARFTVYYADGTSQRLPAKRPLVVEVTA